VATINTSTKLTEKYFGLEFDGYLKIPETAVYIISIASNDGSLLYIDGQLAVNNDEDHPYKEEESYIALEKGMHAIRVSYFQEGGSSDLKIFIQGPDMEKREISAEMYWAE
jgi:hexosaminidase